MNERCLNLSFLLWYRLHRQLRRRSAGVRESGAFLLGVRGRDGTDTVRRCAYYDDLDPTSLAKGYVDFHAAGFARLWAECRRLDMEVLGDVHTHPSGDSSQSETDRTHPMIGEPRHIALIVPRYAVGQPFRLNLLSVYEYRGNYQWQDWTGPVRSRRVQFTWW